MSSKNSSQKEELLFFAENLKSLQKFYKVTNEKLGEAIFVKPNTVTNYRNGDRIPDDKTRKAIADFFGIPVYDLMYTDLSNTDKEQIDIWKSILSYFQNLSIIFPIVCSDSAMKSQNFCEAYSTHQQLYTEFKSLNISNLLELDIEEDALWDISIKYRKAFLDNQFSPEAAINYIAITLLLSVQLKGEYFYSNNKNLAVWTLASKQDKRFENELKKYDFTYNKKLYSYLNSSKSFKELDKMKSSARKNAKYSDLVYYYLALQYIDGFVDNNSDIILNQKTGYEMIHALISVGNPYAIAYNNLDYLF